MILTPAAIIFRDRSVIGRSTVTTYSFSWLFSDLKISLTISPSFVNKISPSESRSRRPTGKIRSGKPTWSMMLSSMCASVVQMMPTGFFNARETWFVFSPLNSASDPPRVGPGPQKSADLPGQCLRRGVEKIRGVIREVCEFRVRQSALQLEHPIGSICRVTQYQSLLLECRQSLCARQSHQCHPTHQLGSQGGEIHCH